MDRCAHAGRLGLGELPKEVAQDLGTTHHPVSYTHLTLPTIYSV